MATDPSPARRTPADASTSAIRAIDADSFIGREHELGVIAGWLQHSEIRLIVLTGPPGVGKTRLAMQVAHDAAGMFTADPVVIFLLAIRDPNRVMESIARAFGVIEATRESEGSDASRPLHERLADRIGERSLLLVLDNFEHVLPAAAGIARLLAACPRLRVLATSRQRLHLHGESLVEVQPLALPNLADPAGPGSSGAIWDAPAVALFAARAGADLPSDDATAHVVAQICARLDGLPLAIELAAAQMARFSPPDLLEKLDHRLPFLGNGRATQRHHRTLQESIAWSYDLLPPESKTFFDRLSVFVGGFDLEAAVTLAAGWQPADGYPVCGGVTFPYMTWETLYGKESPAEAGDWDPPPLLPLALTPAAALDDLLDRHLIRETSVGGQHRYELLETMREFGLERLKDSKEAAATHHAHAALMVAVAEAAGTGLTQHDRRTWLRRIVADLGNVEAALEWLGEAAESTPAANQLVLRLADSLANLWQTTGRATLGRSWLDAALARPGGTTAARASALYDTGLLAWIQGDYDRATAALEEGVTLSRRCGYQVGLARCLFVQGLIAWAYEDYLCMGERLQAAVAIYQDWNDPVVHGLCLVALGIGASAQAEHAPAQAEGAHGPSAPGALATAVALLDDAYTLFEPVGFGWGLATARLYGAAIARAQGDRARAVRFLREALKQYQTDEDPWGTGAALSALAIYVAMDGDLKSAVRLFGAVAALQEQGATILPPTDRESQEATVYAIRAKLGESAFAALFAAGRAMDAGAAIAAALAVPTTTPNGRKPPPAPALAPPVELTERQLDTIQRLADGENPKEIALARSIGQKTVNGQIQRLCALVQVKTPAQLVAYALRRGLI